VPIRWTEYKSAGFYDEIIGAGGRPREGAARLARHFSALRDRDLRELRGVAELSIVNMGITFSVYSEKGGSIDRAWPFDIIPRIIRLDQWERVEKGLAQRVRALNMFIDDIYHKQRIIKDRVFPAAMLEGSKNYRKECAGVSPPLGIWAHICGSDIIRGEDGSFLVLEDNLRVPSGVSYMLENRLVMKRALPELFEAYDIRPVDDYPSRLFETLSGLSPRRRRKPEVVVLTPGIYNSAYFEHSYLAQQMGAELVVGRDLVVGSDDCVYMKTIEGLTRVDVIYRRIDDLYLDPEVFVRDSTLGVPGLMRAWKKGKVALANAPGAGVADDKAVYAFVPKMIKYYLGEEAIIPNVPTYLCMYPKELDHVLANLDKLVVKPANESGGYGMLIGPMASKREIRKFSALVKADPRNYIAQPLIRLSTVPTLINTSAEPRHVDLRPFILSGRDTYVTEGGLTRVALRRGSTVVNSSQGGGSKDTWVVNLSRKGR